MHDRPHFLSFLEGIGSIVILVVMLCGFVGQYFIFRTHAQDFEEATEEKIQVLTKKHEGLEVRVIEVTVADAAVAVHIGNIKEQIDRIEVKLDKALGRKR